MWEEPETPGLGQVRVSGERRTITKYLACGEQHVLVVNLKNGHRVFSAGNNEQGQLGNGQQQPFAKFASTVSRAWGGEEICVVAAGARHSAAVSKSGALFTWGANDNFQLGHTHVYGVEGEDASSHGVYQGDARGFGLAPVRGRWADPLEPARVHWFHTRSIRILTVDCGAEYTLAIDAANTLYTWGQGNYGNLGHGDTFPRKTPEVVKALEGQVFACAAGAKHALAICFRRRDWHVGEKETTFTGGEVFSWGHSENGRLGHGDARTTGGYSEQAGCLVPTKLPALESSMVVKVAAGEAHSAAVLSNGTLYTWGSGSYGRLGLGGDVDVMQPTKVILPDAAQVRDVSLGAFHTMIVSTKVGGGNLYGCGDHEYGKLGLGPSTTSVAFPTRVGGELETVHVDEVCCGAFTTIAWAHHAGNDVYGWGAVQTATATKFEWSPVPLGDFGLGTKHGKDTFDVELDEPRGALLSKLRQQYLADDDRPVFATDVSVGTEHTLALSREGLVYSFGSNEFGQLGDLRGLTNSVDDSGQSKSHREGETVPADATEIEDSGHPRVVKGPLVNEVVRQVVCGGEFSLVLTSSHHVYSWGRGEEYQLGLGQKVRSHPTPQLVSALAALQVVQVGAGQDHAAAVLSNGHVFTWGSNEAGKLGLGESPLPLPLLAAPPPPRDSMVGALPRRVRGQLDAQIVRSVSLGLCHSACVTRGGHVFTWGCGWQGRLGLGDFLNRFSPQRVCGALYGCNVEQVSCGAHHTLAVADDDLYGWGLDAGRLGRGHDSHDHTLTGAYVELPLRNESLKAGGASIARAIAGTNHSVVVTRTGSVLSCGSIEHGRLGHAPHAQGDNEGQIAYDFKPVPGLPLPKHARGEPVPVAVTTWVDHSAALYDDGGLYFWGSNRSMRFGMAVRGSKNSEGASSPFIPAAQCNPFFARANEGAASQTPYVGSVQTHAHPNMRSNENAISDMESVEHHQPLPQASTDTTAQLLLSVQSLARDSEEQLKVTLREVNERERECQQALVSTRALKREITALESRIKIFVRMSMKQVMKKSHFLVPAPRGKSSDVGSRASREKFERVMSLLRAHPCFLVQLYKFHFHNTNKQVIGSAQIDGTTHSVAYTLGHLASDVVERVKEDTRRSSSHGRRHTTARSGDSDTDCKLSAPLEFVNLTLAVYGELSTRHTEHLFLSCLTGIINASLVEAPRAQEPVNHSFLHQNTVLAKLVDRYFTSSGVVSSTTQEELSRHLSNFMTQTERYSLRPNPLAVYEDLRHEAFSSGEEAKAHVLSAYELPQVQEEVLSRVAILDHHVREWLGILKTLVRNLNREVTYLLSYLASALDSWYKREKEEMDGSNNIGSRRNGDEESPRTGAEGLGGSPAQLPSSDASPFATREIGRVLVQNMLKKLLLFPKHYGLVSKNFEMSRQHSDNLHQLVQVLDRVVSGQLYDHSSQPWMDSLNTTIQSQSLEIAATIRSGLLGGPANEVQRELKKHLIFDNYEVQLAVETEVVRIRKNVLLYLRHLLHVSHPCIKNKEGQDWAALRTATKQLLVGCPTTSYTPLQPKDNTRVNLRIDNDLGATTTDYPNDPRDHYWQGPHHSRARADTSAMASGTIGKRPTFFRRSQETYTCASCGVSLPSGMRPAWSNSLEVGATNFITMPVELNDEEKNLYWVLHDMHVVVRKETRSVADLLRAEMRLPEEKDKHLGAKLERYLKYHQALDKVEDLGPARVDETLRRIISVTSQQQKARALLQEVLQWLGSLHSQIEDLNDQRTKYWCLIRSRNLLQTRAQQGKLQLERNASSRKPRHQNLGDKDMALLPATQRIRLLVQGLEPQTGFEQVRGIQKRFSAKWMKEHKVLVELLPADELKGLRNDLEAKLSYVVTSNQREQSSYIFNVVLHSEMVVDTFYVSLSHLQQLRRSVAEYVDSAATFGGSRAIVASRLRIKPLLHFCNDNLEKQVLVLSSRK